MRKLLFLILLLAGCARPDTPMASTFAVDPNQGIWEVQVYFKGDKKPWALAPRYTLSLPTQIRAMKTPGISEIATKVSVPFEGFSVCTDCPYTIRQIKAPVEQPVPVDTVKAPIHKL